MLEESNRLKQELDAERARAEASAGNSSSPSQKTKMKDNSAELQREVAKAREEGERWKVEAETLSKKLEQTQEDQQLLTSQFRKNVEDLYESNAKFEESLKQKTTEAAQQAEKILALEAKLADSTKKVTELTELTKEVQQLRERKEYRSPPHCIIARRRSPSRGHRWRRRGR